jgi:hypothetical protein
LLDALLLPDSYGVVISSLAYLVAIKALQPNVSTRSPTSQPGW